MKLRNLLSASRDRFLPMLPLLATIPTLAQPDPNWLDHDRLRPQPSVVTPGMASTQDKVGMAPSDAVVLFDGQSLTNWVSLDGSPTKWITRDGYMECVRGSGYIRTLQNFGDCQLHVEWATPTPAHGEGQGRGNSGVFFGLDRYEIQVLDSYHNQTYSDGGAAAVYGQYPPLVNASRPPGEWQTYDIIYTAPRFEPDGKLISPVHVTVFHNGVLVQNNVQLTGPNIWVRELGKPGKKEFTFSDSFLDAYAGKYERIEISRQGSQLVARVEGVKFVLFAESPTNFFAKTTDVQIEFPSPGPVDQLTWSVGEGANVARKNK